MAESKVFNQTITDSQDATPSDSLLQQIAAVKASMLHPDQTTTAADTSKRSSSQSQSQSPWGGHQSLPDDLEMFQARQIDDAPLDEAEFSRIESAVDVISLPPTPASRSHRSNSSSQPRPSQFFGSESSSQNMDGPTQPLSQPTQIIETQPIGPITTGGRASEAVPPGLQAERTESSIYGGNYNQGVAEAGPPPNRASPPLVGTNVTETSMNIPGLLNFRTPIVPDNTNIPGLQNSRTPIVTNNTNIPGLQTSRTPIMSNNTNIPGLFNAGNAASPTVASNTDIPGLFHAGRARSPIATSNINLPGPSIVGTSTAAKSSDIPGLSTAGATAATTATHDPRSVVSLFAAGDPRKQERTVGSGQETLIVDESTQPDEDHPRPVQGHIALAQVTYNTVPSSTAATKRVSPRPPSPIPGNAQIVAESEPPVRRTLPPPRARQFLREEADETVPDSEPTQADARDATPLPPPKSSAVAKRTVSASAKSRGRQPQEEAEEVDVVPDSWDGEGVPDPATSDDSDEELPLAVTAAKSSLKKPATSAKAKGKQKAELQPGEDQERTPVRGSSRKAAKTPETGAKSAKGRNQPPSTLAKKPSARKGRGKKVTPAKPKVKPADETMELDAQESDSAETVVIPEPEDDQQTELADPDEMRVDDPPQDVEGSRKRKRVVSGNTAIGRFSRASTRATSKMSDVSTASRLSKRYKGANSDPPKPPTRVVAKWDKDGCYYSGTIVDRPSSGAWSVYFDDGSRASAIATNDLRKCEFREGDQVLIDRGEVAMITKVFQTSRRVRVEVDNGEELDHFERKMSEIRIPEDIILAQWKDRMVYTPGIVISQHPDSLKNMDSPSKLSIASSASSSKPLQGSAFVVSMSVGNDDTERDAVIDQIKRLGGRVLDDWTSILNMDGSFSNANRRWTIRNKDVKVAAVPTIKRVFLLSDEATQKPRYLMALALGIPCVSTRWLHECDESFAPDWHPYLLPAGRSDQFTHSVSQLINWDWGQADHVSQLINLQCPMKVLRGKTVLCLGLDFVPNPRAGSRASKNSVNEGVAVVPRIVLAMGADLVEAAAEPALSSSPDLSAFDLIMVKSPDDMEDVQPANGHVVHLPWIKDCLITNRLHPYPSTST
ncbi:hypothetical protein PUNSTDRAFT_127052 [Punctularia strigosozonata HHB-11173 SS5]|uniref:uncharacterized protein n=1 Tax=Punctularia strigosozonata (strain HHB-11173) TaxID=741275 RepID=UPI00044181AB|nr:uncharacterized protein PUNSTDRAFT_127052 [Punctularia strigosozonata HHB-11173 SS5]EIN07281.1 hypothetical protein PUNSTDRAFT_127052 [Punctularia strigosozonata HHB-11173 SS5]